MLSRRAIMSTEALELAGETPHVIKPVRAATPWFFRLGESLERRCETERDQLALWLPVALLLGIAFWFWLPAAWAWTAFMAVALGVGLALGAFAGATRSGRALAIFA